MTACTCCAVRGALPFCSVQCVPSSLRTQSPAPANPIWTQVSKEGDTFEVPVEIAKLSNLVVTTLGEDDDEEDSVEIPLPNVKANVLAKVIEYCTHYKKEEASE